MDLNLPILDGLKATQLIRKLPNGNIPIIAITASTFSGVEENCLQHNITHVLNKPIDKVTLEMALHPYRAKGQPMPLKPLKNQRLSPSPTINQQTITMLIEDLGREKVHHLLEIYQKDGVTLVAQLKSSSAQESKAHAHTLAGMSENLGIMRVGKTAREIMGASQDAPHKVPDLIQDLEEQFKNSLTEIQNIVSSSSSTPN